MMRRHLEDWRNGGLEDWRTEGLEDWRNGGLETKRPEDLEDWRPGDVETWISRGLETWISRGQKICRSGDMEDWTLENLKGLSLRACYCNIYIHIYANKMFMFGKFSIYLGAMSNFIQVHFLVTSIRSVTWEILNWPSNIALFDSLKY